MLQTKKLKIGTGGGRKMSWGGTIIKIF